MVKRAIGELDDNLASAANSFTNDAKKYVKQRDAMVPNASQKSTLAKASDKTWA